MISLSTNSGSFLFLLLLSGLSMLKEGLEEDEGSCLPGINRVRREIPSASQAEIFYFLAQPLFSLNGILALLPSPKITLSTLGSNPLWPFWDLDCFYKLLPFYMSTP
jgi:hypothetical protein